MSRTGKNSRTLRLVFTSLTSTIADKDEYFRKYINIYLEELLKNDKKHSSFKYIF